MMNSAKKTSKVAIITPNERARSWVSPVKIENIISLTCCVYQYFVTAVADG